MSQIQKPILFFTCLAFALFITHVFAETPSKRGPFIEKGTTWDHALDLLQKHGVREVEEDMAMGWTPGAPKSPLRGYLCLIEDGVRLRVHYDTRSNAVDSMRIRYAAPFLECRGNYRWFTCTKLELHNDRSYTIRFGPRREIDVESADKVK